MKRYVVTGLSIFGLGLGAGIALFRPIPPIPMDAIGAPETPRAVSPTASPIVSAPMGKRVGDDAFGSATAAAELPLPPGTGRSAALFHAEAGATAERNGESAPVGRGFRRHRAPFALLSLSNTVAGQRGIPVHVLAGLAEDESSWRPRVVGARGEVGLLQLTHATAEWCGGVDRYDAHQNLDCGARYLLAQFERFGSWQLAFVAYKAGPGVIPERIPARAWTFAERALERAEAYR